MNDTSPHNQQVAGLVGLPDKPGIYLMKDRNKTVIYIGKAKSLKKRVKSYFNKRSHDSFKTTVLVSQIVTVETIVTTTEKEALILENQLIKQYQPKYNILLKDDKSYPYIKITTSEPFPKIVIARDRKKTKDRYFGPYPSIGSTRYLKRLLVELFPVRDCKQKISLDKQEPKCILLDMGKCIGPCVKKDCKEDYDKLVQKLCLFLEGKDTQLRQSLYKEMKQLSPFVWGI